MHQPWGLTDSPGSGLAVEAGRKLRGVREGAAGSPAISPSGRGNISLVNVRRLFSAVLKAAQEQLPTESSSRHAQELLAACDVGSAGVEELTLPHSCEPPGAPPTTSHLLRPQTTKPSFWARGWQLLSVGSLCFRITVCANLCNTGEGPAARGPALRPPQQ